MTRRRWRDAVAMAVLVPALGLAILACGGGSGSTISLTAADAGTTVQAKVGDPITITLEANPTTGYDWHLQPGLDEAVVSYVKQTYEQGAAASGLVGAGGEDVIEFKAVGAGTTSISLAYTQAGSGAGDDTFEVDVTVQ
jgi:inhibitor of cysteine peptidase